MANQTLTGRPDAVVARVERKKYSPHQRLSRHVHAEATILCVIAGGFTERLGRHQFECSAGMVLMRGPNEPHADACGPRGAECLALSVSAERLASDPLLGTVFAEPTVFRRTLATVARRIDLELARSDRAASLAVEGLALQLLGTAIRATETPKARVAPKCLRDAHELIEAEFATSIRIADVAAAVGVHPVYLARAFRAHLGYSPSELVRLRRLENAARMLGETSRSLSEIAFDSGFASQSHFSTSFVNHTGLTPSEYRVTHRHGHRHETNIGKSEWKERPFASRVREDQIDDVAVGRLPELQRCTNAVLVPPTKPALASRRPRSSR